MPISPSELYHLRMRHARGKVSTLRRADRTDRDERIERATTAPGTEENA
jgi:hypothetical protein